MFRSLRDPYRGTDNNARPARRPPHRGRPHRTPRRLLPSAINRPYHQVAPAIERPLPAFLRRSPTQPRSASDHARVKTSARLSAGNDYLFDHIDRLRATGPGELAPIARLAGMNPVGAVPDLVAGDAQQESTGPVVVLPTVVPALSGSGHCKHADRAADLLKKAFLRVNAYAPARARAQRLTAVEGPQRGGAHCWRQWRRRPTPTAIRHSRRTRTTSACALRT